MAVVATIPLVATILSAQFANSDRTHKQQQHALTRSSTTVWTASFELAPNHGGMLRIHLRGRASVYKRYLVQVAAYDLGLAMRALLGAGTPKTAACGWALPCWSIPPPG